MEYVVFVLENLHIKDKFLVAEKQVGNLFLRKEADLIW
jgi:hypothetical protein